MNPIHTQLGQFRAVPTRRAGQMTGTGLAIWVADNFGGKVYRVTPTPPPSNPPARQRTRLTRPPPKSGIARPQRMPARPAGRPRKRKAAQ